MDHSVKAATGNGDCNSNGSAEVGIVELLFIRKDDSSWHHCKVSICPTGLAIEYLDNGSSEIIVNKQEAMDRIRFCSIPLKDDDCSLIQKGDHVLAKRRVCRETLLLDAKVDKVRNSRKAHPRCTFVVKWIKTQVEGEAATVQCNSMWKVSTKDIKHHPTIFGFVTESSSLFSVRPKPTPADEMDSELDTNELEKQIEKINNSADAAEIKSSEKELKDDMLGTAGHGLTRMRVHMEVKNPLESRSLLNPIAARAALASMISKLHHNGGVPFAQQEAEEFTPSKVSNGCTPYNNSAVTNCIKTRDDSLDTNSGKQKHATRKKNLFPNGKTTKETSILDSPCVSWNKRENDKEPEEYPCVSIQSKSSKDVPRPSNIPRRVTRSAIKELEYKQSAEIKIDSAISVKDSKEAAEPRFTAKEKHDIVAATELVHHLVGGKEEEAYSNTKRGMSGTDVCQASSSSKDLLETRNSRRLTRSSAQGVTEKDYKTSCKGLEENRSSGRVKSNKDVNGTIVTAVGSNEGKVFASISTPKLGDEATMGRQGTKRKLATLMTQAVRSSPRLRLLAQTGTGNKS